MRLITPKLPATMMRINMFPRKSKSKVAAEESIKILNLIYYLLKMKKGNDHWIKVK